MRKEVYDIGGMHCAACAGSVERVTRKLPGVASAEVNLPMNRLTIRYDEGLCTPEAIIKKVERAGFTAQRHGKAEKAPPSDTAKAARAERLRLIFSSVCAGLLLAVSMGPMLFPGLPLPALLSPESHPYNYALVQLLLCIPVLLLGGRFFIGGFRGLFHGSPNMDTLVAVSAGASFLFSLVNTFLLADNPHGIHNLYYESAAVVVALVSVGKYLEAASQRKTQSAITGLMSLTPDTALLAVEGGWQETPVARVKVGDIVLVKPGARVPLDGVVTDGGGSVNEAMLTGESMPVVKAPGSRVIGGSVSAEGALTVRVTQVGEDTTLAKIIRFVEDAQGKKAPISRTADKVAGVFVPIVMAIALLAGAIWLLTGAEFSFALRIFTCVLVIACPCAMGLATPTAIIVATGLGANHGILIRSGEALETTHKVKTVIFDKTGTVTEGKPGVTEVIAPDEAALLSAALSLEQLSGHPLSAAICTACAHRGVEAEAAGDFRSVTGKGLSGRRGGLLLLAGSAAFLGENGVDASPYAGDIARLSGEGQTPVLVAEGGRLLGLLAVADSLKPEAAEAVAALKAMGIRTVLLTGDSRAAAEAIGRQAGVDEIRAEVLPTEKAAAVQAYQAEGSVVMMVGDGINDAPALTQADVGCAMGSGSDIAMDSADIVLMKSDLTDVCRAIRLSHLTIRNIRQNLFWAFCYNVLGIPVAAGVLYPAFGLLLSPMVGGLAMSLSSLFVVTNALRLKGKKL